MMRSKALVAAVLFPAMLLAVVYALVGPDGGGAQRVEAEFQSVDLLVPGHDVRVRGTKVGRVERVTLTDRGSARVTLALTKAAPRLRADASASVRSADLLGDVYLALEPGRSAPSLRGEIPASRTYVATRVQDVFDAFDPSTRLAAKTILVELGAALDARGADLNGAVKELAPTLDEVSRISTQLSGENTRLERLIDAAHGLTASLAPRTRDIDRFILGVQRTLDITATRTPALEQGLRKLPATLEQARTSLARLGGTAAAATPLAEDISRAAIPLRSATRSLAPFAVEARPTIRQLRQLVRSTAATLRSGRSSLPRLNSAIETLRSVSPALASLAEVLDPLIVYGVQGVFQGLGSLAAEPGDQGATGTAGRNQFRGELFIGCEMFGVPIRPGCLSEALGLATRNRAPKQTGPKRSSTTSPKTPAHPRKPPAITVPDVPSVRPAPAVDEQLVDKASGLLDFLLKP
jgi:phospholipid/cholesterol/gamma-HCH transport system substrate-binding protein